MNAPSRLQQLTGRWKAAYDSNTRLGPINAHRKRVTAAADALAAKQADLASNRNFSDAGRTAELRTFAGKEVVPKFAAAIRAIEQNEKHLERRRVALLPTLRDPTNVAAAIMRAQMRDHLAGLKPSERMALLHAPDADPRLIESVIEAPTALSGLTKQEHATLMSAVIEREHGPAAAVIAEEAEAVSLVRAMTQIATTELQKSLSFPHATAFSQWMDATAEASGATKTEDPEIAALSVNVIAEDASRLSPAARRGLIDTLLNQNAYELTT